MKVVILSLFFLLINQNVWANEKKVCRFDSTPKWEYQNVQNAVSHYIKEKISEWLKQRDIINKSSINSYVSITQRFSDWDHDEYPESHLMSSFWIITDKDQELGSSWGKDNPSREYRVEFLPVVIRDNQGIPLKKICQIIAKENIILQVNNATQGVRLDEINLYKKNDVIFQFKDDYLGGFFFY